MKKWYDEEYEFEKADGASPMFITELWTQYYDKLLNQDRNGRV